MKIKMKGMFTDKDGKVDFKEFLERQTNQLTALNGYDDAETIANELGYIRDNLNYAIEGINKGGVRC